MAQQETSQSRGWIVGIAVLVVCVAAFFVVRNMLRGKVEVRSATVSYEDLVSSISTNGKVEPVQDYQAHASAPGVVQKLLVNVGDKVKPGTELVRMDDSDARKNVAAAQAVLVSAETTLRNLQQGGSQEERLAQNTDLKSAQAQVQVATTSLQAMQTLQSTGAASPNEVASAKQRLQDAQARVAGIQARQTGRYGKDDYSAQQAQVTQAKASLAAAEESVAAVDLRSPLAGSVYSIPVSEYDFVQGGEALMNVADLNHIQVRAYFDEPEIGKLAVGQPVKIVWDAKPLQVWHGHIALAPTTIITYGTRNVGECLITVDDAKGDLLPNTNVTVTVTTQQKMHVLSIPREALRTNGPIDFVYKIVDGKLKKTTVQVGALNLTRVEIVSGLTDSDVVALGAKSEDELTDGLEVKAQP